MQVRLGALKIEDRISNDLSGIVNGGLTAAVDLNDVNTAHGKNVTLRQNASLLRRASECYHTGMLTKHERIGMVMMHNGVDNFPLPTPCIAKINCPPVLNDHTLEVHALVVG